MQANTTNSTNKLVPPDALSYSSEGYVNDDEDIADIRRNKRRSFAPSETSESYMDMSGRPLDMDMNSAYNVANSVEVPREDPPRYDYVVAPDLYEEIPGRGYPRPPIVVTGPPPVARGPPLVAREPPVTRGLPPDHEMAIVKEKKDEPKANVKILCSFWQGRTEIGLRATILILELLLLAIFIAAFVIWRVATGPTLASTSYLVSVSLGTGFLAVPAFFFLIIVTVEEIAFFGLRLGITVTNSCTNCILIWDIVNSTLVGILFFLSTVGSIGVAVIWMGNGTVTSDVTSGQVSLFILTAMLYFIAGILCIVKTVWIPVLTYKRKASSTENQNSF